jgi:hypothetical protein
MGHKKNHMKLTTYNMTAERITNGTVQQNRSKAMDMRFYWIKDYIEQDQLFVNWATGDTHTSDYFTKFHASSHHAHMRPFYLHTAHIPMVRHTTKLPVL